MSTDPGSIHTMLPAALAAAEAPPPPLVADGARAIRFEFKTHRFELEVRRGAAGAAGTVGRCWECFDSSVGQLVGEGTVTSNDRLDGSWRAVRSATLRADGSHLQRAGQAAWSRYVLQHGGAGRLQRAVMEADTVAAACAAVRALWRILWDELVASGVAAPGGESAYDDALLQAGFLPGDREELALHLFQAAQQIVGRYVGR